MCIQRGVLLVLMLSVAGCSGVDRDDDSTEPADGDGHLHMLQHLDEVARQAAIDNPFFGEAPISALRRDLEALPQGQPDPRRWSYNRLLGKHELRVGNIESAVARYDEAYRQLQRFSDKIPPNEVIKTIFEVAVAHLRMAAGEDCIPPRSSGCYLMPIHREGSHPVGTTSAAAIRHLTEVLELTDSGVLIHIKAKWLLNLAYMGIGEYPDGVPARYRIPREVFASEEAFPRFDEIAGPLGLDRFDLAGGAIVEDFDGDGFLDIVVSSSDPAGQMGYYANNGDGTFVERTTEAGLEGLRGGLNMVHADYDNDGAPDILVLRGAWCRQHGRFPNSLLRNVGGGRFVDVTFEAGLGERHYPTQTASWSDYDNDGDLDLFIGNEYDRNVPAPSQLFRNDGDGTFTEVTEQAGVPNNGFAKGVIWGDYDGDRFPDLYVSNLGENNRLFHNNRDGTFTDVAEVAGVTRPGAGFGAWFWDYDNDGALDLFAIGYGGPGLPPDVGAVAASYLGVSSPWELDRLYRGDGKGGFEDVGESAGLNLVTLPMGANFGDLDNDGFLDYYLGTGYPYFEGLMPNVLYRNRAGRFFSDVTFASGMGHLQKGHGVVFADLDHDGDQDVFHQVGGMYPGDAFGNALFRNPGFGAHWIKLRLVGVESNRSAIGVRIRVDILEAGQPRSIHRHVTAGGTFGSNPLRQEIGLGQADQVRLLEIYWPTSDRTQRFHDVPIDRFLEITEGVDEYREIPLKPSGAFAENGI